MISIPPTLADSSKEPVSVIATPFADALQELAHGYRSVSVPLTSRQRTRWREAMAVAVRKYHDIVIPAFVPPMVSEAADAEAQRRGIELTSVAWHDQPRFDPGRKVFHLEHFMTISTVVDRCLTATRTEVTQLLVTDALQVAWILKEENVRLDAAGARARRPDPVATYQAVGITLVGRSDATPAVPRATSP